MNARSHLLAFACVTALFSGACGATSRYVMRVDRQFDRAAQPPSPHQELAGQTYRAEAPTDRWEVSIDGPRLTLVAIGTHATNVTKLEGREVASKAGERRFDLQGAVAGGRFVLREGEAELTLYGSGVPVVSSERGRLLPR